jgi:hypothetical protein
MVAIIGLGAVAAVQNSRSQDELVDLRSED